MWRREMNYYLGVSCEEYKSGTLFFCHADSLRLCDVLKEYCDYDKNNCNTIMPYPGDTDASSNNVLLEINELCNRLTEDDVFIFFFAGHGTQKNGDALLLFPDYDEKSNPDDAISVGVLRNIFSSSKGFCISIIDACHSGTDIKPIDLSVYSTRGQERGWAVLASCSGNEESNPYCEKEQGAFSYFLANCIEEWECNGAITVEELKNKLCDVMEEWCEMNYKSQHPTLNGSVIGRQVIANRNNKPNRFDTVAIAPTVIKKEIQNVMNEVATIEHNSISLWNASEGIILSKSADVPQILHANVKLPAKTINAVIRNFTAEDYESTAEIIWERSVAILRNRILAMGVEFVGEMVGLDNLDYIRNLPAFEVINLATELGFIDTTGKMRLTHANEIVHHYRADNVAEEMPKNEIETVIRACVQYITGYDDSTVSFEFSDFRNNLKREYFSAERIEVLRQSPYFYKKTTMRTLTNLLNTTEGAEYQMVASNFVYIIEAIWDSLSSDDRYIIGTNYSKYANLDDKIHVGTYKYALERVHGFDYVPENLRSLSFVEAAKHLKNVHHALNNFYNEPEAAQALEKLGTIIPRQAIKECTSATLVCLTGNAYGRSVSAIEILRKILEKLDKAAWAYYLDECFAYDEDFLFNIAYGDNRTYYWCQIVKEFELNSLSVKDGKLKEMLNNASKDDKVSVKSYAIHLLKKLNKY